MTKISKAIFTSIAMHVKDTCMPVIKTETKQILSVYLKNCWSILPNYCEKKKKTSALFAYLMNLAISVSGCSYLYQ